MSIKGNLLATFSLLGSSTTSQLTTQLVEQGYGNILATVLHNYTSCLQSAAAYPKMHFNVSRYSVHNNKTSSRRSLLQLQRASNNLGNGPINGYIVRQGDTNSSYNLIDTQARVPPRALDPGHRNTVLGGASDMLKYEFVSFIFHTAHVKTSLIPWFL